MKLMNDFFRIEAADSQGDDIRCTIIFNPQHAIYRGHFPGNPITPGVCLIQAATEILEQHKGKRLLLTKISNVKFKTPVSPDIQPTFIFTKQKTIDNIYSASVSIEHGGHIFVKMALTFQMDSI